MGLILSGHTCAGTPLPLPSAHLQEHPLSAAPAQLGSLRALQPQPSPPPLPLPLLPCRAVLLLVVVWALPLWPLPRGDIIHWLAPLLLLHRIPCQPGGPHCPRGPGLQAQGSRPPREPECHPNRLIKALLEPRTYPLHPLSGGLTSITAPSRGILTTMREICTGRFTTISRHLPRTRSSENPCSLCRDTTWSRS